MPPLSEPLHHSLHVASFRPVVKILLGFFHAEIVCDPCFENLMRKVHCQLLMPKFLYLCSGQQRLKVVDVSSYNTM